MLWASQKTQFKRSGPCIQDNWYFLRLWLSLPCTNSENASSDIAGITKSNLSLVPIIICQWLLLNLPIEKVYAISNLV